MELNTGNLLREALKRTCSAMLTEVQNVPLEHWNEAVFRWLLIRHLREVAPETQCWQEWNRVDLVLPALSGATLIELKFFARRRLHELHGRLRMKGGPSEKNVREFWASVENLATSAARPWAFAYRGVLTGYLVLAYCDPAGGNVPRTFGLDYDNLQPKEPIASIETITDRLHLDTHTVLTCKLLSVHIA
jgi:hypothetical protein